MQELKKHVDEFVQNTVERKQILERMNGANGKSGKRWFKRADSQKQ